MTRACGMASEVSLAVITANFAVHLNQFPVLGSRNMLHPLKVDRYIPQEVGKQPPYCDISFRGKASTSQKDIERAVLAQNHLKLSDLFNFLEEMIPIQVTDLSPARQFEQSANPAMKGVDSY